MAEAGHPVSELYPLGGAVSLESTLSGQSVFHTSKRSTQARTPSKLAVGPGYPGQEEQKEAAGEICKEHSAIPPTTDTNCSGLRVGGEPGEREQSPSEHCVPPRALSRPHSLAEKHTPSHHHEIVVNAINDNPLASRTVQSIKPASLPVHRSHSDTLPLVKQGVPPPTPAESHSMLACKQPMQLQQCNIITTICRGANGGEGGAPQSRCVCVSSPKAAAKVEGVEVKGDLPLKCDKALCYGSYIHHANFEDTFAAYCHPQPIPAPSQLLPRLAGVEPSCDIQRTVGPPSAMNHLTLPRLISSVSDTGLDAKHLLRCCNLNYSWISSLPPGAGPQSQKHFGGEESCSSPVGHVRTTTRDMGTMTAHRELRDVGVQTGQTVTPHVFPHICLTEESRSETSSSQTPNTDSDGGRKQGGAPKSPVKEVKWDAEGMTWEVYGASVDPEELGLAIQKHLELQIKETASHAAKLSQQNANTSRQRKRRMMGSIRTPACCARTTTAVD
ncbi:G protein-regulated inducer of neurite outgrowth 2 [Enoplosus armatus]|uniref:G protein-regulated inducer of neurite outgrowth 2 n=1 Tax=Enoplosus armatus TaxID=215367 RepID=UPI0039922067